MYHTEINHWKLLYCSNVFTFCCGAYRYMFDSLAAGKHIILAVTSLNSKIKESSLHIFYAWYTDQPISSRCQSACQSADFTP